MKNCLSSLELGRTSYHNTPTRCFSFLNNLSRSPDIYCFKNMQIACDVIYSRILNTNYILQTEKYFQKLTIRFFS